MSWAAGFLVRLALVFVVLVGVFFVSRSIDESGAARVAEEREAEAAIRSMVTVGSFSTGRAAIEEVELTDGTRCAVLIGHEKGAIDCDWGGE